MTTPSLELYFEIPLTQGKIAIVNPEDYPAVSQHKWQARKAKHSHVWYACRSVGSKPNQKTLMMHREIMLPPGGIFVDHINQDGLDNRRSNLRLVSHAQNVMNQRRRSDNLSGFKGVSKLIGGKWQAAIFVNRKQVYLGSYLTPEEAYAVYCRAAKEHFGEFARLS